MDCTVALVLMRLYRRSVPPLQLYLRRTILRSAISKKTTYIFDAFFFYSSEPFPSSTLHVAIHEPLVDSDLPCARL